MIDYERVRSTVRPEPMLFDEYSVWLNTEISEIEGEQTEYEYRMIRYTKDEYIKLMAEKNAELERYARKQMAIVILWGASPFWL